MRHAFSHSFQHHLQHNGDAMDQAAKVRENRIRRMADRRGYRLMKSRSRDRHAVDYGLYALIDVRTDGVVNTPIAGHWACSWTLDDVEDWLTRNEGGPDGN